MDKMTMIGAQGDYKATTHTPAYHDSKGRNDATRAYTRAHESDETKMTAGK